ncbi:hypothetical protein [Lacinutrix cladophorae]
MKKLFVYSRVNFFSDFVIILIIVVSPFLFYLYTFFPENVMEWKTMFFYLNLRGTGFELDTLLWYFSYKILTTIIFCVWYLTCKHWWKYLILVPIFIELNKITLAFYEFNYDIENYTIFYSLILSFPLIMALFLISKKLNYYSLSKTINKQIDEEINLLTNKFYNYNKQDYKELKRKLSELRKQKVTLDKKEYLIKLIKLREDFSFNSN